MGKFIFIETWGGIGDAVLSTSALRELKLSNPSCKIILIYHAPVIRQIFQENPFIYRSTIWFSLGALLIKLLAKFNLIKLHNLNYARLCPGMLYQKKATSIIADILGIKLQNDNVQLFINEKENVKALNLISKYKNPIIINVTAVSSENKMWPYENWEKLILELPEYNFIQLGTKNDRIVEGAIDLRGQTTIRESIALVKNSLSFIGIDSFLSHVTNSYDIPGVVLFGSSTPIVWGHKNNINITKDILCSPCMDILREGAYCPFSKKCMTLIEVEEVKTALNMQINKARQNQLI